MDPSDAHKIGTRKRISGGCGITRERGRPGQWRRSVVFLSLWALFAGCRSAPAPHADLPFDPEKSTVYTREELWSGYDPVPGKNASLDRRISEYFTRASKYAPPREQLLAQRRHDANMDYAVNKFLGLDGTSAPQARKIVAILGSHSTFRDDPWYRKAAELGYALSRAGYFVVSGGGPGLMEATHLGAWMSRYDAGALADAVATVATTSKPAAGAAKEQYDMPDYWLKSQEVLQRYPSGNESLGIPTWFYGHEGANAFSTHVAKYFSNALREEKICAVGVSGVIFLPGGLGTAQEAFMDAAENGYASYNWYSPMIFYSDQQDSEEMKNLILKMMAGKKYGDLSMVTTAKSAAEAIAFIRAHPPQLHAPPEDEK
jgi:predicted Rossmann-fold nucleotide-binding protein